MRAFNQRQRHVAAKEIEVGIRRRRDARKNQHRTSDQREGGKQERRQPKLKLSQCGSDRMFRQLPRFEKDDEKRRDQQGQDVIDDAIEDEAAKNLIDIDGVAESGNDNCLENAQPRRNVAENAGTYGSRVNRQKRRPADSGLRQKNVKHGRGCSDIECSDEKLLRRSAAVGKP
ncbi:hypothetical protein D3C87_1575670 [compost metagenome]